MDTLHASTIRRSKPLTDRTVATLKPEGGRRISRPDGVVPGLAIRVNAGGRKTWTLTYRVGRRQRRWTVGTYPVVGLKAARKKAQLALAQLDAGMDPADRKRADRDQKGFGVLTDAYMRSAKRKKRSWKQDDLMLRSVLLPVWKHRPVKGITRRDVRELLAEFVERGKPVMANRVQALISTIFNYAIREEWLDTGNPAALIVKQPETSRERVLTDGELRTFWSVLEHAKKLRRVTHKSPGPAISPMIARGLQVLLLTAQRSGEVFTMKWEDLDLPEDWEESKPVSGWWTIRVTASKNKRPHRVPLTASVVALLREARIEGPAHSRWVFAGEKGGSVAARASKAMAALRHAGLIDFAVHRHDLRRTASTELGRAGFQRSTIAQVLNHIDRGSRTTQIYDRYDHDAEKRSALEAWARRLDDILTGKGAARVLAFARA